MKNKTRTISELVSVDAKKFALYTIQKRALPSLIDGLKPVNRYILYSVLKNAGKEFKKNASVAGVISDYGYNHGEQAALDAACLMASTWNNNFPVVLGRGNFGSRIVKDGASPRYIFCTKHDNFDKIFKDLDQLTIAENSDIPNYYLPTVPYVLLNGISGIATGYKTDILPHSIESVAECMLQYIKTGKCDEPVLKFPKFYGDIVSIGDNKWRLDGKYELIGKTKLVINEIPIKYDREKYVSLLNDLIDSDRIVDYNESKNGKTDFCFKITLKRDFDTDHDNIMKVFKLSQTVSQMIHVIDHNGDLKYYDKASDLIIDFVKFRTNIMTKRIENRIAESTKNLNAANAKVSFIKKVISGEIVISGKTRKQAITEIEQFDDLKEYASELVSLSLYTITTDEIAKLEKIAEKCKTDLEYWKTTDINKQIKNDIKEILK